MFLAKIAKMTKKLPNSVQMVIKEKTVIFIQSVGTSSCDDWFLLQFVPFKHNFETADPCSSNPLIVIDAESWVVVETIVPLFLLMASIVELEKRPVLIIVTTVKGPVYPILYFKLISPIAGF